MRSGQKRRELTQNLLDRFASADDGFQKRLSLENLRLGERYIEGKLNILVRFKIPLHDKDRIALFSAQQIAGGGMEPRGSLRQGMAQLNVAGEESFQSFSADLHADVLHADGGDYQEAVLVDVVKLIESPERVVPSLVRVGSAQRIFDSLDDSLYFSARFGQVLLETLRVFEDRESRPLFRIGRRPVNLDKLPPQVVESASQVVDCVAVGQKNLSGNVLPLVQIPDRGVMFDVILGSSCIGVRAQEFNPFEIELADVLLGPFNF